MRDVPFDGLLDKLCDYVFTALTIISLTLEKKEFGHGGEQGLRFPLKLSTSQTLEKFTRVKLLVTWARMRLSPSVMS